MTEFQKPDNVPVRRKVDYNLEEELAHSRLLFSEIHKDVG